MFFISIPDNYVPVTEPLPYRIGFEEQRECVDVKIVDITHNAILGVKRFYDVQQADVDIAPYVNRCFKFEPFEGGTSLSQAEGLFVEVALEIDGIYSETRFYSRYPVAYGHGTLFRAESKQQNLSRGENDYVVIYAPNGGDIFCEGYTADVATDTFNLAIEPQQGLQILKISPDDFATATDSILLEIKIDEVVSFLTYRIVPKPEASRRLAWIAPNGLLQLYTFPICRERRCRTEKHRMKSDSGIIVTSCESEVVLTLVSDYETEREIERIGEILGAKQVWLDCGNSIARVDVLTAESVIRYGGALNSLQIEIRSRSRKEPLP